MITHSRGSWSSSGIDRCRSVCVSISPRATSARGGVGPGDKGRHRCMRPAAGGLKPMLGAEGDFLREGDVAYMGNVACDVACDVAEG